MKLPAGFICVCFSCCSKTSTHEISYYTSCATPREIDIPCDEQNDILSKLILSGLVNDLSDKLALQYRYV